MATRARDISQGTGGANAITLSTLTTSNVAEGSNLYFTNARVYANITLANIDILYDVDTSTSKPTSNQALIWNATVNNRPIAPANSKSLLIKIVCVAIFFLRS